MMPGTKINVAQDSGGQYYNINICIYFYFAILASRRKNLLSQRNLGVKNIFEQKKIILQILKHQSDKRSIISLLLLCLPMSRVMAIRVYWKVIYFNILFANVPKVCNWVWVNKRKKRNSNPRPGISEMALKIAQTTL